MARISSGSSEGSGADNAAAAEDGGPSELNPGVISPTTLRERGF